MDAKVIERFWSHVDKSKACWTWKLGSLPKGYGTVRAEGRRWLAHRLAWTVVNGPIPEGLVVAHRCDNPSCVRTEPGGGGHLFLATQAENLADMVAKGRQATGDKNSSRLRPWRLPRGSRNFLSKLTEAKVLEIRQLAADGVDSGTLGERFGVTRVNINCILRRFTWRHVGGPERPTARAV